jgi:hypothetical protein
VCTINTRRTVAPRRVSIHVYVFPRGPGCSGSDKCARACVVEWEWKKEEEGNNKRGKGTSEVNRGREGGASSDPARGGRGDYHY